MFEILWLTKNSWLLQLFAHRPSGEMKLEQLYLLEDAGARLAG